MGTITIGGQTYTYDPAGTKAAAQRFDIYKQALDKQKEEYTSQLDNTLDTNNKTTNTNYDNTARQAYIKYMQNQRALPNQLQALGVRGGASESALLNLYNNYGSAQASNNVARNSELATNKNNRDDAYNTYYNNYLGNVADAEQQALADTETAYNNEITQFSSTVHQYPTTYAGYQSYVNWINNLSASDDPLKEIKIALVRQQMATQFPDGTPSSGSSGGGGGGSSRSYSGGGGGGTSLESAAKSQASTVYNAMTAAAKSALSNAKKSTAVSNANKATNKYKNRWTTVRG